jgi:hypothetical protein
VCFTKEKNGKRVSYTLDSGGEIEVTMTHPLSQVSIKIYGAQRGRVRCMPQNMARGRVFTV